MFSQCYQCCNWFGLFDVVFLFKVVCFVGGECGWCFVQCIELDLCVVFVGFDDFDLVYVVVILQGQ